MLFVTVAITSSGCRGGGVGLNAAVPGTDDIEAQTPTDVAHYASQPTLESNLRAGNTGTGSDTSRGEVRWSGRMQGYPFNQSSGDARYIPDVLTSLSKAAKAIPRLGSRSVTQSTNTSSSNMTTDITEAVFDRGQLALNVTRQDGSSFSLDSGTDTLDTHPGFPIRSDQTAREWQLEKKLDNGTVRVRSFGEKPSDEFPFRAIHTGMQSGVNWVAVQDWKEAKAAGRSDPLVPLDSIEHLKSINVNWVGLSVSLMYESTTDSTVKPIHTHDKYPNATTTYTDDELRQIIRELKGHGFNVYMTLTLGDAEVLGHPIPPVGNPVVPRHLDISPKDWPWAPDHPDHERFVAEFLGSYADQAVHYATIAQEEGVGLYSLGTEEANLFRTGP